MDANYQPYGPEWEKEMMKFPKPTIVQFLGEALEKLNRIEKLSEQYEGILFRQKLSELKQ